MKIALFPGHVGKDSGAIDKFSADDGLYTIEATINSAITAYAHSFLNILNISNSVYYGSFEKRIKDSWDCYFGVSIHCDWIDDESLSGYHLIHWPGSQGGSKLSKLIQIAMDEYTEIEESRPIQTRTDLAIIRNTTFPTVILEAGFLSHIEEEDRLNNPETQISIGFSIAAAIQKIVKK